MAMKRFMRNLKATNRTAKYLKIELRKLYIVQEYIKIVL